MWGLQGTNMDAIDCLFRLCLLVLSSQHPISPGVYARITFVSNKEHEQLEGTPVSELT